MIEAFAKNTKSISKIMVVEPPLCIPVHLIANTKRVRLWWKLPKYERITDNLWIMRPYTLVPNNLGGNFLFKRLYYLFVSRQIQSVLKVLDFKARLRIAYITRPDHEHFLELAKETYLVYECRDNHSYRPSDGKKIRSLEKGEFRMLNRASIVFASSEDLYLKMSNLHRHTYFMPNGVNFDLFSKTLEGNLSIPYVMEQIPKPRICYVGSVWPPFDFKLLNYLTKAKPKWSFILIGPCKNVPVNIKAQSNVYFLGKKKYEELPNYLKGIDVAILPRVLNPHTESMNPLKFWEYLAAGKPIVSTALKQAGILQDVVLISKDYPDFLKNIEKVLTENNYNRIQKGIQIARRNSWDNTTRIAVAVLTKIAVEQSF